MQQSNISKWLNFIVPNILASSTIPYIIVKSTHTHNPLSMHFVGFFVLYQEKQDSARSLYSKQNLSRKQTNLGTYVVFIPPFVHSFNSFVYGITSHSEKLLRTLGRKEAFFFFFFKYTPTTCFHTTGESDIIPLCDLANSTTKYMVLCPKEGPDRCQFQEITFQALMEDTDKSIILIKCWSPKAHPSVSFFPPASKSGFPGTLSPRSPLASRLPTILTSLHSFYAWF